MDFSFIFRLVNFTSFKSRFEKCLESHLWYSISTLALNDFHAAHSTQHNNWETLFKVINLESLSESTQTNLFYRFYNLAPTHQIKILPKVRLVSGNKPDVISQLWCYTKRLILLERCVQDDTVCGWQQFLQHIFLMRKLYFRLPLLVIRPKRQWNGN